MAQYIETLEQIYDILNDYIIPGAQDHIITETSLWDKMKRSTKDVYGRKIIFKHKISGNASAGWAKERGQLPAAKARDFKEMQQTTRYFYIPVELTNQQIREASGKGKGAMIDVVADALEDAMNLGIHKLDVAMYGDGSGRLGRVNTSVYNGTTGHSTVVLYNTAAEGYTKASWFLLRQGISFGTGTTEYEIVNIAEASNGIVTLTLEGDCSTATGGVSQGDYIYNYGSYSAAYDTELWGLGIHVNTGNGVHANYQGVDRTATGNTWAQAYINSNSGTDRVLSNLLLRQHFQKIKQRGGELPDYLLTNDGVLNSYIMLLESLHQQVETMPSETGSKEKYKFIHGGKPLELEVALNCLPGRMYTLNTKYFELRESAPLAWDNDGGGRFKPDKNQDIVWGRMYWYGNVICLNNEKQGVMMDIKQNSITA